MKPSLAAGPEIVAIPGPSVIPDRVLAAMHRAMPDIYAGELEGVIDEVFDGLPGIARTSSRAFVVIGNGHAAWSMALSNTLDRGDRVLVLECGLFATVWGELADFDGLEVEVVRAEAGRAVDPAAVEERLRADRSGSIAAVLLAHADTASSVRNDVAAIRQAIDATGHRALLMVDAIASLACERYEMDAWGVDITVGACQKGLMVPPGLSFVWAGPRALAAHPAAGMRTRYWDWTARSEDGPYYRRFCGTPPVTHLYGLREALRMIGEEGLEQRWARHRALADAVRAAVDAWAPAGLAPYARDEHARADGVTTIVSNGSGASPVDVARLRAVCRDELGVTLGTGIGGFGDGFRIGHMGHVNAPMLLGVVGAVDTSLAALGSVDAPQGALAAARSLAAALADVGVTIV